MPKLPKRPAQVREMAPVARQQQPRALPGFAELLGLPERGLLGVVTMVRRGLSYATFRSFLEETGLSQGQGAALIGIPPRTLQRRRQEGRLSPEESDRLLRAARVLASAVGLFEGDMTRTRQWLETPAPALGGEIPLRLAETEVGARAVEQLIGRLEHGVPS
jgi:putative toxin-antitoxin system antitoxin component (TIGR02293 family)